MLCVQAEQDRTILTKRVQEIEASLTKKEELRLSATIKLARATELADDAQRFINLLPLDQSLMLYKRDAYTKWTNYKSRIDDKSQ